MRIAGYAALLAGVGLATVLEIFRTMECGPPPLARLQLAKLAQVIEQYRADTGAFPETLSDLLAMEGEGAGSYLREADLSDPWGRAFYYRPHASREGFVLFTLGRDGLIGGDGTDADIGVALPEAADRRVAD